MTYIIISLGIFIQAIGGFGAGLFAIPLLTLLYEPKFIVPSFSLLVLTFNIIMLFETKRKIKWDIILNLILGAFVGVPFGVYFLKNINQQLLKFIISFITFSLGIYFITGAKFKIKEKRIILFVTGVISGFFSGSCAMGGPPVIILGISMKWEKEIFRKTLLTYFAIAGTFSNLLFLKNGLFNPSNIKVFLFSLIPVSIASFLGIKIKNKLSEEKFRKIILILIIFIGLIGILKSLTSLL